MSDEQRAELRKTVRGTDAADPVILFAQPGSMTRVYAVASGKGGVGKSSVTVNLAAALAKRGLSVGVVDADIYSHSVPRMLGVDDKPTQVDNMIMPPQSYGVKVISIGMFTPGNTPVVWRGPMLHRALQQFLADRSEEHTSELQSRQYLVCRLLLEKKKSKQNTSERPP